MDRALFENGTRDPSAPLARDSSHKGDQRGWLKAIAVFRVVKAVLLIAVAIGAFSLIGQDLSAGAEDFIRRLDLHRESQVIQAVLEKIPGLTPGTLKAIGGGALAYAALFLVEAYGLFRGRTWAEWLTIVATTSFIPLEIYEIVRHFHAWKIGMLVVNIVIVAYLLVRRLHARQPASGGLPLAP